MFLLDVNIRVWSLEAISEKRLLSFSWFALYFLSVEEKADVSAADVFMMRAGLISQRV